MRTIFIDDNKDCRNDLRDILLNHCPDVVFVGEANSVEEGYQLIKTTKPDLAILDIELSPYTSFDLLQRLSDEGNNLDFEIIFLTAFQKYEYPLRAIQYSALAYEHKPIEQNTMIEAINKAKIQIERKKMNPPLLNQVRELLENVKNPVERKSRQVTIESLRNVLKRVNIDDLVYCEANEDTTIFYLKDGSKLEGSKNLGYYSRPFELDFNFFRVHHSFMLNLDYLDDYNKLTHAIKLKNTFKLAAHTNIKASKQKGAELSRHLTKMYEQNVKNTEGPVSPSKLEAENTMLKSMFKSLFGG
jgi:two-component system, LytTR family, response regulator